ncbi:hypothetical protein [Paenibacillus sp. MCAF9]
MLSSYIGHSYLCAKTGRRDADKQYYFRYAASGGDVVAARLCIH